MTSRPELTAAELGHLPKHASIYFRVAGLRAHRMWPRKSLPALDKRRVAAAPANIGKPRRHAVRVTNRHRHILDLLLARQQSKNIAADLGISSARSTTARGKEEEEGSRFLPALLRTAICLQPGPQDRARMRVWIPGDDEQ